MEVTIPRLCVGLPAEVVSDAIIGAFQQLGYSNPTASQKEATLDIVKGRDVFHQARARVCAMPPYLSCLIALGGISSLT